MNIDILVKCISMVCEVFKAYLAYLAYKKKILILFCIAHPKMKIKIFQYIHIFLGQYISTIRKKNWDKNERVPLEYITIMK